MHSHQKHLKGRKYINIKEFFTNFNVQFKIKVKNNVQTEFFETKQCPNWNFD